MKYQAHINIEYCNKSNSIAYLFKHINKGVDRVTMLANARDKDSADEINQYYNCRYLSPCESVWRIFAFDIHRRWPSVQRLTFHLPRQQNVIFNNSERLDEVVDRSKDKGTMFLSWMEANKKYTEGGQLTYAEFPVFFVFSPDDMEWKPRERGPSIGRLTFVPPRSGNLHYLRLLLNVQVGCMSYQDIKTVGGRIYDTFREACGALGMLEDDQEFIDGIKEESTLGSGFHSRKLFATLLLTSSLSDPLYVWQQTWEILSDGIMYEKGRSLNCLYTFFLERFYINKFVNDLEIIILLYGFLILIVYFSLSDSITSPESVKNSCLVEIEKLLRLNGKTLKDFVRMPSLDFSELGEFENILLASELMYDKVEMLTKHKEYYANLNFAQKAAYDCIVKCC